MIKRSIIVLLFIVQAGWAVAQNQKRQDEPQVIPVGKVWSGHPVGFDLLTTDKYQYAAYYDADRNMVVAQRPLDAKEWKITKLPTTIGWDSHNYVRMTMDRNGYLHVSGNMHNVPLIYFRSTKPESVEAFEKLPMTSKNEERVTYPVFFKDQQGDLYFQYRNGGSGQGISYWNKYDADNKEWKGLFDTPLFDGEQESNSYMTDPKLGPDGYFYTVWMWRLTPMANTNHNLSCVRSKDLVHWENLRGDAITLPIKWRDNLATVDPVGPWNGLINMSFQVNWDQQQVPLISYHKFDQKGISQLYLARWDKGSSIWQIHQISTWKDFTWDLNRNGSLANSVGITSVKPQGTNELAVAYHHEKHGKGTWILDRNTLKVKKQLTGQEASNAPTLSAMTIQPGMNEHRRVDNTGQYIMQWQTLPTNQDRPREAPHPAPSDLLVYKIPVD
ncbi:BNR repeat-containing protein [Telluribacter humicola]|uniref:BNR repeat-containing protein n=1 Tax=Telluribacter humicola TaxID=1720261 RepID=UPI001A97CDF4|nr:BNR repeat-containing protein [Telluribacter humicola]